ncbi:MAG: hypothetical protein NUV47_00010 [Patescibacteria group bacterium]|nr:hypothetical protein [Patescibacteria group bacterium]
MIYSHDDTLSIAEEDGNEKLLSEIQITFNSYEYYDEVDIIINKRINGTVVTTLGIKTNYYDFINKIERIFKVDNH